jgi:hypothetical protein
MAVSEKISALVRNQFPAFYKEEGENFLAFIEAYYEYLEQNGKMTDAIRNLESYRDIDETLDEYIEYFRKELLPSIPINPEANPRLLAKQIKTLSQTRGTLASYRMMFRALYNEDVELHYPSDQILKVSDGDYRRDRYLVTSFDEANYKFIGKTIKGSESQSEALVEDVIRRNVNGRDLQQIIVSNIKGSFYHLEPILLASEFEVAANPHAPLTDAGIKNVHIVTPGGQYLVGDEVDLISGEVGRYGKVVVTQTEDLGGSLSFRIADGGSGFVSSQIQNGTRIDINGGDGDVAGSFIIRQEDIVDPFALAVNRQQISSNNVFGGRAPTISGYYANGDSMQMYNFANTIIGAPRYGFDEIDETLVLKDYHDHANAVIKIATTSAVTETAAIFGVTSGANGYIDLVQDSTLGASVYRINGYKNFQTGETVRVGNKTTGNTIGTVTTFWGNTAGYHVIQVGNTAGSTIVEGDELVGTTSNAYGVVKRVLRVAANGYSHTSAGDRALVYAQVAANTTANTSSYFDTGPIKAFIQLEGIRKVGSTTIIGNSAITTANVVVENVHTKLEDALTFTATQFGTIGKLSLPTGGSGYSIPPTVTVTSPEIRSFGIGEQYITIQSDDVNWGTGNSQVTVLDTNDRLVQASTGASGDVKAGDGPGVVPYVFQHANGTYESTVRVWQDFKQRAPGNVKYANNSVVELKIYGSSYTPGEADTRTPTSVGSAKIVSIQDEGILGENAVINASVGANGTITQLRVTDSGFNYKQGEIVKLTTPTRELGISAEVQLNLGGVANSAGYYATTRGHLSSARSYLQDSDYYQEFSYELITPISFDRYKEVALKLCHPAGNKLFGKFRQQTNAYVDVVASTVNMKRLQGNGTISITDGSFNITGSGTSLIAEHANNGTIIIEYAHGEYYQLPLNIVSSDTSANVKIAWSNTNLSGANTYYMSGSL